MLSRCALPRPRVVKLFRLADYLFSSLRASLFGFLEKLGPARASGGVSAEPGGGGLAEGEEGSLLGVYLFEFDGVGAVGCSAGGAAAVEVFFDVVEAELADLRRAKVGGQRGERASRPATKVTEIEIRDPPGSHKGKA